MFKTGFLGVVAAMSAAACASGAGGTAAPAMERLAIVGATVLPMTDMERLEDQTILIEGDRIVSVGPRAQVRVPEGYRTIAAHGRFVMPGLVDMHIHLSPEPGKAGDSTQRALAMELANGVTTARVMLGQPVHPSVRAAVESGTIVGPRIYIAWTALNDQNTPTPDAARDAVRKAKAEGFDLMKAHGIENVATWEALQDEARKQSIPVAGHVTNAVGLKRALAAKQQVEHLDSVPAALLPPAASRDFGQFLDGPVLADLVKVPPERFAEVAREAAGSKVYFVPTLAAFERIGEMRVPFEQMVASEPDSAYVAPWIIEQWRSRRQNLESNGFTLADSQGMASVRRRIVKAFNDAGVPMMAGSDTPHPFHVWGFGLVRELEALSAAGLGPMGALRAATVVPRDYLRSLPNQGSALGWAANFGTVEPGARADLLLLDRDPSRDIGAVSAIRAVIAGGRVYERSALEAMLAEARKSGKSQPQPGG